MNENIIWKTEREYWCKEAAHTFLMYDVYPLADTSERLCMAMKRTHLWNLITTTLNSGHFGVQLDF